jgi:hypothetical protein
MIIIFIFSSSHWYFTYMYSEYYQEHSRTVVPLAGLKLFPYPEEHIFFSSQEAFPPIVPPEDAPLYT